MYEYLAGKLISLTVRDPALQILGSVEFSPVQAILDDWQGHRRGPKPQYPNMAKLKSILYFYLKGITSPTEMERQLKRSWLLREFLGFKDTPSHDILNDFINALSDVIEYVFSQLTLIAIEEGIITGERQAMDGTKIETRFLKSAQGAKWSWDDVEKRYYYGYGLLVNFDAYTQLPIGAVFTKSKKVSSKEIKVCMRNAPVKPKAFYGDGEFDIIKLHKGLMLQGIYPIIPYNPRRGKKLKIRYRIEQFCTAIVDLDEEYDWRASAEHGISTLKERFNLEEIVFKKSTAVKTHLFLCLIARLMDAIALKKKYPDVPASRSMMTL